MFPTQSGLDTADHCVPPQPGVKAIEAQQLMDADVLAPRHQVRVGEVEASQIQIETTSDHTFMLQTYGGHAQNGTHELDYLASRLTIWALQNADAFGHMKVEQEQLIGCGLAYASSRPSRLASRVSREVADKDAGVEKNRHRAAAARCSRARRRIVPQEAPLSPAGTGTLPARSKKSGKRLTTTRRPEAGSSITSSSFS